MQNFNKISPLSLLDNAVMEIRAKILSGELRAGEWLPSERDMAAQMCISRSSLHQAILELEYQGFVKIVPRRGTRVQDFRKYPTAQSLTALMSNESLNLEYPLFRDMMDFRLNIEGECARLACSNIYEKTLSEMEALIEEMSLPGADFPALAYSFHYKLTQASGNSLYSMVFRGFETVITNMIDRHYALCPEDIEPANQMRRELLAHIRNKNESAAAEKVREIVSAGISVLEKKYK